VEQDLLLSRLIVEIANDPMLGSELAFRGGTCFHKLFMAQPLRYSEDLDYVRVTRGPIGPIIEQLEVVARRLDMTRHSYNHGSPMVQLYVSTPSSTGARPIRIKIETNFVETEPFFDRVTQPLVVDSRWFSGRGAVLTFRVEELLATKLRALYQRRKGRDLFDLWCGLSLVNGIDDQAIVDAHRYCMGDQVVAGRVIEVNVDQKLDRPDYSADIEQLVGAMPAAFTMPAAAALVKGRLLDRLS